MNLYDSILQPELLFAQTDEDATCVMYEFIVFGVNVLGMGDPSASVQSTIPIGTCLNYFLNSPCLWTTVVVTGF